jgi:hypothetical protein
MVLEDGSRSWMDEARASKGAKIKATKDEESYRVVVPPCGRD